MVGAGKEENLTTAVITNNNLMLSRSRVGASALRLVIQYTSYKYALLN